MFSELNIVFILCCNYEKFAALLRVSIVYIANNTAVEETLKAAKTGV